MWEFVRLCAAHPALRGKSALDAFQQVSSIRLRDGDRGFPWEESFLDSDDPRMEFIATWDKVRIPAGDDILDLAVALAKEKPLQPRNCISEGYGRFVSIAGWLQQLRPGNYINLPVERLGTILKVDPRTVSHYAAFAKSNRLITLIAKAHKPSRQASKYVFHCDRFNMESGEELPPAKDPHFHKECKESEDCEDSKENHEQGKTSRTLEEAERPSGRAGLEVDFQRKEGNPRAVGASKIDANPPSGRHEELKRQCEFLEAQRKRN
jgi:hypothetical protein